MDMQNLNFIARQADFVGYSFVQSAAEFVLDAITLRDDIACRMQAHQHKKSARLRALHW